MEFKDPYGILRLVSTPDTQALPELELFNKLNHPLEALLKALRFSGNPIHPRNKAETLKI